MRGSTWFCGRTESAAPVRGRRSIPAIMGSPPTVRTCSVRHTAGELLHRLTSAPAALPFTAASREPTRRSWSCVPQSADRQGTEFRAERRRLTCGPTDRTSRLPAESPACRGSARSRRSPCKSVRPACCRARSAAESVRDLPEGMCASCRYDPALPADSGTVALPGRYRGPPTGPGWEPAARIMRSGPSTSTARFVFLRSGSPGCRQTVRTIFARACSVSR